MKKKIIIALIVIFIGLPILMLIGVRLGWTSYIEPKIRSTIISSAQEQGYELSLEPLSLQSWWLPLHLQVHNVQFKNPQLGIDGKVSGVSIVFAPETLTTDPEKLTGFVKLTVQQPQVTITQTLAMQQVVAAKSEGSGGSSSAATALPSLKVDLIIQGGQFVFNQETAKGYNQMALMKSEMVLYMPQILQPQPAEFELKGNLVYKIVNAPFPLEGQAPLAIVSKGLELTGAGVQTRQASVTVGGMRMTLKGGVQEGVQNWQIVTDVPDINDLQKGGLLPPGNWKGGLAANLQIKQAPDQEPELGGTLQFKKLRGRLKEPIEKQGTKISGGFALQGSVGFAQHKILKSLQANIAGNLSSLNIYKEDLFLKKAGVPLSFSLQSKLKGEKIHLSKMKVQLAQIAAQISGVLATTPGGTSRLKIQLPKTDLKGLEAIFLPMKQYPVKGRLAVQAEVLGNLQKPESLKVTANPIDLQIQSGVSLQDQETGFLLKGPFQAKMKGLIAIANKEVMQAQLVGNANLDALTLKMKNGLQKKANQKLNLVFNGGKKGKVFNFSRLDANTFFGNFKIKGSVNNPLKPKLKLNGSLSELDLVALKSLFKSFKKLPIQGTVNGSFKVDGAFDSKLGVEKSPLKISGKMLHNSSLLKWTSPPTQTGKEGAKEPTVKIDPKPLLPDWPVIRTAQLAVVSKIEKVIFNGLTVTNFHLNGRYDHGVLTGQISMQRLFSGNFVLKDIRSDLYQVPTYIQGTAITKGLNLRQAVTWGVPEQKDLVKGSLTGGFKVKMPFPSHADPLLKTVSSGAMTIQGFEVSTLKLDQMINGLIQKIPGLKGKKKVHTKDVKALFKTKYLFKNGVLTYKDTDFLTPENHQLLANGTLHMDQSIRLKGDLMVSGVKVKDRLAGCLLDSQGRLKVPVEYVGSIVEPKVSNSAKVIEKIGGRYLECEKKSQLKKAKAEVKKETDKLLKKEGKKLEEKLKDKLKNIF